MPSKTFDVAKCVVTALSLASLVACGAAPSDDSSTPLESELTNSPIDVSAAGETEVERVHARLHPTSGSQDETAGQLQLHGVNLSGAEFAPAALPGVFAKDYTFPTNTEFDYYIQKGMNAFRIPFQWERLQPAKNGVLDATYLGRIDTAVKYATGKGATVVLDPQNFAKYYADFVGSANMPNASFADLWKKLSAKYASNPRVMFNLMNEPHGLPTEQWASAAQAAVNGIRSVGATNVILAPGNAWTGAWSWGGLGNYGTSNAVAMLKLVDPADNMLFEVHQYLDSTSGGSGTDCASKTIGSERLAVFVKWLRDNKKKGFVGEFAGGRTPTCNAAITDMMTYMNKNADVLRGWLWWGGGPWWKADYNFALDPVNNVDRPQMAFISPML